MSLLEAAACGRPLIATDVPGCREIARHGVNGLLVPPDDPAALADAIETLANDRGHAAALWPRRRANSSSMNFPARGFSARSSRFMRVCWAADQTRPGSA